MKPKISVIVPIYNQERYLEQCLDSLKKQTFRDFEVICVNDGSTDASYKIAKVFCMNDIRFFIANKPNGGLSSARNYGLQFAEGDVICFLDSDDWLSRDTLDIVNTVYSNYNPDILIFNMEAYSDGQITQDTNIMNDYLKNNYNGLYECSFDLAKNTNIHACNKAFKRSVIDNLFFKEGLLYEDIYFVWSAFFRANTLYYLSDDCQIQYHYRVHQGSIMETTNATKSFDRAIDHLLNWYELFRDAITDKHYFAQHYDALEYLLDRYKRNTQRNCTEADYFKIDVVYNLYRKELDKQRRLLLK